MTTIYLIRHGQASVGAENYDVLSAIGETQAKILGEHLAGTHISFDAVYSGKLKRQIDTATLATGDFGVPLRTRPEFNEYHHRQIFNKYLPSLAATDNEVSAAMAEGMKGIMTQSVFNKLMMAWVEDTDSSGDIETWQQFNQRIADGIDYIIDTYPDKTIAVFTSGGVITSIFRHMFSLPPQKTFEMNWNINNAGITSIKHRSDGLSLREYNNISHLLLQRDKTLITQI
jgi:broad specificity phosphatase PhoE